MLWEQVHLDPQRITGFRPPRHRSVIAGRRELSQQIWVKRIWEKISKLQMGKRVANRIGSINGGHNLANQRL